MFRLFKRDSAHRIPDRLAQAGPPGDAGCDVSTCASTMTWECTYTDSSGSTCETHWCPDHLVVVDGAPFCRRHAGVASLLLTRVGTLMEMPVPRVDDRSLPLLLRMAAQLDERIAQLLQHLYHGRYDVEVSAHPAIRELRDQGRILGWQALWTATSQVGHLTTVSLRSNLAEPPVISIARDGRTLSEGVPDWVRQRDDDRWNGVGDNEFVDGLFGALVASFSNSGSAAS
jgi:hypothetical protein